MKVFSYFNMWYISSILFRFLLNFSHKLYTIFRFCTNDSLCSPFLPQCHPCDCCLFHRPSFFDLPFHVYLRHIDCQHHSVAGIAPKPLQSTVTVTLDQRGAKSCVSRDLSKQLRSALGHSGQTGTYTTLRGHREAGQCWERHSHSCLPRPREAVTWVMTTV